MNFRGRDFGKNNYVSDVINTLCTKSNIRLGNTGDEVFYINPDIQLDLKSDFDKVGYNLSMSEFNDICKKYNLPMWTKIFKGDFSGYTYGLSTKNMGSRFEDEYVNNFDNIYRAELENKFKINLYNAQILKCGSNNTKRPLSKNSKTLYLGDSNPEKIGALIKDVLITDKDGKEYCILLKYGKKVTFINTGVKEIFPEKSFKEYAKTGKFETKTKNNVSGQDILDMLGIDGNRMAEVFNKYIKPPKKEKSIKEKIDVLKQVKSGCLMDFMQSVIGCGYILVHNLNNKIHIYDLRTKSDLNDFIGSLESAEALYPTDGKSKQVQVNIETTKLKLSFVIRSKNGEIYPDSLLCEYIIK